MILPHLPSSPGHRKPSSFTPTDVHAIFWQSSSTLRYLHNKKAHHNDIEPANITYSPSRGVTLINFGLATNADEQTMTGGTPWYVPPDLITERHRDALGGYMGTRGHYALRIRTITPSGENDERLAYPRCGRTKEVMLGDRR
ncbi:MAP kinase kinase skh1/pek1 [Colletotrichum abscissum]|uniref:MAP kinase kinase skh1/pek1 n=1 Tax=Colletotrichum abscissum TaxID=1671311 RepID=UPI0027D5C037|nr:MAP kinase kinase skh1/pek1 [Colletotrichum abscissum]KAK1510588.1 MAP kinase kinase skh1/pek1 [Colletotrichum abscissum]